jgi:hypothetical protein
MSQTITVRLNRELSAWLEKTASRTGVSQGQIVREQLARAKAANANRTFMRWAGVIRGPKNLSSRKGFSNG